MLKLTECKVLKIENIFCFKFSKNKLLIAYNIYKNTAMTNIYRNDFKKMY